MTYKELREILDKKEITDSSFCRKAGILPQTLSTAKSRGGHFSADTYNKIMNFINKDFSDIENESKEILDMYNALSEKDKIKIKKELKEKTNSKNSLGIRLTKCYLVEVIDNNEKAVTSDFCFTTKEDALKLGEKLKEQVKESI